jgi:hypothetical protein
VTPYGLGRLPAPDERDAPYAMRTAVELAPTLPTHRYWDTRYWSDQGPHPHCVGHAWAHWLELGPVSHDGPAPILSPLHIYNDAQKVDEWPGEGYDGTSVRAGAKVLQSLGFVSSYLWAFDAQTVMDAVLGVGPVVVGTWWFSGMFEPDAKGFIYDTGHRVGGHAYVIDGANQRKGTVRIRNSWGRTWGKGGRAWMDAEVLDRLIAADGEACLAIEQRGPRTTAIETRGNCCDDEPMEVERPEG